MIFPFDWKLPPQGKWCNPYVCAGLRSMLAACTEIRAFVNNDNLSSVAPPFKIDLKSDKKPPILERRLIVSSRTEGLPPPSLVIPGLKKQAVEPCVLPLASGPLHLPTPAVPPLDMTKVWSSRDHESASHAPSLGLLMSHGHLPPTAFITANSENSNVSFCMPRGMNRLIKSRQVQLPIPPPSRHHPLITTRQRQSK